MTSKFLALITLASLLNLITISSFAQTKKTSSYKPGQTFKDCPDCCEMVVIPAGSFMMGAPENDSARYPEEGPQHKVDIKQFAVGKFDITKKEWAAFVKATNRKTPGGCAWAMMPGDTSKPWELNPSANWNHIGFTQDSSHPVVCMSWNDAQDYVRWLSKKTGFTYRLLSEAEWEYADRAGTTTTYPWGNKASHEYANYGVDTAWGIGLVYGHDKWMYTSPVGSFPPNQFGLYDMNGNVLQWVDDYFSPSYTGLPTDGSAYKKNVQLTITGDLAAMNGTSSDSYRICRGGGFGDPPRMIRAAFRNWGPGPGATLTTYRGGGSGFRVARTL
jgi:formylglycine-generating enzyme required for sulfatase activity